MLGPRSFDCPAAPSSWWVCSLHRHSYALSNLWYCRPGLACCDAWFWSQLVRWPVWVTHCVIVVVETWCYALPTKMSHSFVQMCICSDRILRTRALHSVWHTKLADTSVLTQIEVPHWTHVNTWGCTSVALHGLSAIHRQVHEAQRPGSQVRASLRCSDIASCMQDAGSFLKVCHEA